VYKAIGADAGWLRTRRPAPASADDVRPALSFLVRGRMSMVGWRQGWPKQPKLLVEAEDVRVGQCDLTTQV
jgi:hypothetical protein